jgi:branched-chain amino acid transport system ATP-binding protein
VAAVTLLAARGLSRSFGGLRAVEAVDLDLARGEIHALIGPNGAGKTTLVGLISGRLAPDAGTIRFEGADITRLPAHARVRRGIAYTFQITSIYPRLTVRDNVGLAAQRTGTDPLAALARVGLAERADETAGTLAYGHQRLLEIAMGLALTPKLLILDEPTQGLAEGEIERFCGLVRAIARRATVLIIEHNMPVVLALAQRVTVMDAGAVIAEGTPAEIEAHPGVQKAYLGR